MRIILVGMGLFGTDFPFGFLDARRQSQASAVLIANMESLDAFLANGYDEEAMARLTPAQLWTAFDDGRLRAPPARSRWTVPDYSERACCIIYLAVYLLPLLRLTSWYLCVFAPLM